MLETGIQTSLSLFVYFCICSLVIGLLMSRGAKTDIMSATAFWFAGTGVAGLAAYILTILGRVPLPH